MHCTRIHRAVAAALLLLPLALPLGGCAGFEGIRSPTTPPHTAGELRDSWVTIELDDEPSEAVMQIRAFRVEGVAAFAIHPYFFGYDPKLPGWSTFQLEGYYHDLHHDERARVVEVFDRRLGEKRTIETNSFQRGYVFGIESVVHFDPSDPIIAEWRGSEAERIFAVLRAPYPRAEKYVLYPGPNSNSYATWILRNARVPFDPHPMMVGKDFRGPLGIGVGVAPGRAGFQVETPLVGAVVDLRQGVEVHILSLTFGVDLWPPAIKLPFGRFGVRPAQ